MKIKRRAFSKTSQRILNKSSLFKNSKHKKIEIMHKFIKIILILIVGIIAGLVLSGFFGNLNTPSKKLVGFVHLLGFKGQGYFDIFKHVLAENIKIPYNYLIGQFSGSDKLFIDVSFQDWQKIEYKREQALERTVLISSDEDWVNAVISDGKKKVNANIRLKGDLPDHWITDKWSLRIKVSGDETLYGMRSFSIQHPKTRNYLNEFIYQDALKRESVLNVRYKFIEVVINGKNKGIYAFEEHFDKRLIENNERREGPIIQFDEGIWYLNIFQDIVYFSEKQNVPGSHYYPLTNIDSFQSRTTLEEPEKKEQFNKAKDLLESFRLGKLKTHEVFDVDVLAKYMAINTILGGEHASLWYNIKFYYKLHLFLESLFLFLVLYFLEAVKGKKYFQLLKLLN